MAPFARQWLAPGSVCALLTAILACTGATAESLVTNQPAASAAPTPFPQLAHVTLQGPAPVTTRVLAMHGILGAGRNLRTLMQALVEAVPGLQVTLADLRNHGDSRGFPGPQTIAACVDDALRLADHLSAPWDAVIGHSYGGKIAMHLAQRAPAGLRQVWVLDAVPALANGEDQSPQSVENVLAALQDVPMPLPSRQALIGELAHRGQPMAIGQWQTTNLQHTPQGFVWKTDFAAVREMLDSYFATDSWPVLEQPPASVTIHVVRAGRSDRWTPAVLERLGRCPPGLQVHVLPEAGHWLHVDDPTGVLALLTPAVQQLVADKA